MNFKKKSPQPKPGSKIFLSYLRDFKLKRRRDDRHLKALCQCSSRAGLIQQPISESIHKVWTNQKADFLTLALTKSDSLASFQNFSDKMIPDILIMRHAALKFRDSCCSAWPKLNTISTIHLLVRSVISKIEVYKSLNQNSENIHYPSQATV